MLQARQLDVTLNEADLNRLVETLLERPDLDEVSLSLGEGVISGRLTLTKLGFNIPVEAEVRLLEASATTVRAELRLANLGFLPQGVKDLAFQKVFNSLPVDGVSYEQGEIRVSLDEALAASPVRFELAGVSIRPDELRLSLRDVSYLPIQSAEGSGLEAAVPDPNGPSPALSSEDPSGAEVRLGEHQDYYDRLKVKIFEQANRRLPARLKPLVPWLLLVPDSFVLLARLIRDPRVSRRAKWIAALAIAYFVDPLDIIPDAIPVLGQMDDLGVAFFALESLLGDTPEEVLRELWAGKTDVIVDIRRGVRFFGSFLTRGAVGRIKALLGRTVPPDKNQNPGEQPQGSIGGD